MAAPAAGFPSAVAETHAALLSAAEEGDYEALRPHIPAQFSYTFGLPDDGGPIAYWQDVEEGGGESPIEMLDRILRLVYTLSRGDLRVALRVRPPARGADRARAEAPGDLVNDFGAGSGYLGYRTGIAPDGTWRFFIAGD